MQKIISYTVNGIRAAINKGLLDWMEKEKPGMLCIQETKAQPDQVDLDPVRKLGYSDYWHSAEKKGYSGTAIFSKIKPINVQYGLGIDEHDSEGRVITLELLML